MGYEHSNLVTFVISIIYLVLFVSVVIMLAFWGNTLGMRYLYINILTLLFKWVNQCIHKHTLQNNLGLDDVNEEQHPSSVLTNSQNSNQQLAPQSCRFESDKGFQLSDVIYFLHSGMKSIVSDQFTESFNPAKLSSWNLLTRNITDPAFITWHLGAIWFLGLILRYCILFPVRFILFLISIGILLSGSLLIGMIPKGKLKKNSLTHLDITACRIMNMAFTSVITYHNKGNRAKGDGICVANHTSVIDLSILGADNGYTMVVQSLGGVWGIIQNARGDSHICFERSNSTDKSYVANRLQHHVSDDSSLPILIFPEGACVNNTSVVMFNKGSFEVEGKIYPVAIKYNQLFADPFWKLQVRTFKHFLMILTSWAIVADVWYLPPMMKMENETAIDFAKRVKCVIAKCGGLVSLDWDSKLRKSKPKPQMIEKQRTVYCRSKCLKDD